MRIFFAAAIALAMAGPSHAQAPGAEPVTMNEAQATQLRELISRDGFVSITAPTLNLAVGATVPAPVRTRPLPATAGFNQLRYSVVNGRTLLIDPRTRRVVGVIE